MPIRPLFPNLFIIGAMKAGTSSLAAYLHQHPDIFMSKFKEPQYFAPHKTRWGQDWGQGHSYPEPGIAWYLRLFDEAGNAKYAGEASVSYTARPWLSGCEKRIHAFNPEARLIYIMRDPIERSISHYWHFVADGREDRDMLTAIHRLPGYIGRSDYAMQLEPYIDLFGRDRIYMLTLEELNAAPAETFRRMFQWLGVRDDVSIDTRERHNTGSPYVLQTRRGCVFMDTALKWWRWQRLEPRLPGFVRPCLERITYRSVCREMVDTKPAIDYLRPILQTRTERLCTLLGRTFPEWTTLYSGAAANSATPCMDEAAK